MRKPKWIRMVREPATHAEYLALTALEGRIRSPGDVHRLLKDRFSGELVEVCAILLLGAQSQVIDFAEISRGSLSSSLLHPREVFRTAIRDGVAGIILVHNHPSGDPTPSADDRTITRQLVEAGRILDVPIYDHVIIAGERYVSFAEAALL